MAVTSKNHAAGGAAFAHRLLPVRSLLLLLLLLAGAATEDPRCPNDCGEFGSCLTKTLGCGVPGVDCDTECECDPGWTGADCGTQMERCPDNEWFCFNGGTCKEVEVDTAVDPDGVGMGCDCTTAAVKDLADGGQCAHSTEHVCEIGRQFSSYAFCVNGGTCKEMVQPGQPHPLCDCLDEYEGRHCQFIKGTAPESERIDGSTENNSNKLSGAAVFFLVVIILAVVGFFVVVFLRRRRNRANANNTTKPSIREITRDLDLDTNENDLDDDKEII